MGFKKSWDVTAVMANVRSCAAQVADPRNDGWTAWSCKQDLYRVKFLVDKLLCDLPEFADEKTWVEQTQIWQTMTKNPNEQL